MTWHQATFLACLCAFAAFQISIVEINSPKHLIPLNIEVIDRPLANRTKNKTNMPGMPRPIFVLSLPKSGTTSTQKFFNCHKRASASHHYSRLENGELVTHGECFHRNLIAGRPIMEGCGNFEAWTDLGSVYKVRESSSNKVSWSCFFPSVHALQEFRQFDGASILLLKRDPKAWFDSLRRWDGGFLLNRMVEECPGFPNSLDEGEWYKFYENHTESVRRFARENPSLAYLEVQLESPDAGRVLAGRLGISSKCWGHCKPQMGKKRRCRFRHLNESWSSEGV